MTHMKDNKEPYAFQLVDVYGGVHSSYRTWEEADHEATSIFWRKGFDLKIVPVYS